MVFKQQDHPSNIEFKHQHCVSQELSSPTTKTKVRLKLSYYFITIERFKPENKMINTKRIKLLTYLIIITQH